MGAPSGPPLLGLLLVAMCAYACATLPPVPGYDHAPENDLGQTPDFHSNPAIWAAKSFARYGPMFKTFIDGREIVFVANCEAVVSLISNEHKLVEARWPDSLKGLLGPQSLIFTKGAPKHSRTRALYLASLSRNVLVNLIPQASRTIEGYTEKWASDKFNPVQMFPESRSLVFDTLLSTIFGRTFPTTELPRLRDLYEAIDVGSLTAPINGRNTTWGRALIADQKLRAFFKVLLHSKLESLEAGLLNQESEITSASIDHTTHKLGSLPQVQSETDVRANADEQPSILDALLQAILAEGITLEDINIPEVEDALATYFFGGFVTVSQTIARIMWELPQLPAYLTKVQKEQADLVQKYGNIISLDILDEMPFLDALIKESTRIQAPVASVYRQALVDLEVGGYSIPKNTGILLLVQLSCNTPAHFSNINILTATTFDPERWLEFNTSAPVSSQDPQTCTSSQPQCPHLVDNPKAFMPFGGGARQCPGRYFATSLMKITLAQIVRKATWARADPPSGILGGLLLGYNSRSAALNFKNNSLPQGECSSCPGMGLWPIAPGV